MLLPPVLCLQAPGLAFSLPKEYASLPHLMGRATVELTVEKADDSLAFVDVVYGGLSKQTKVGNAICEVAHQYCGWLWFCRAGTGCECWAAPRQ